jgi:hypothetical protein
MSGTGEGLVMSRVLGWWFWYPLSFLAKHKPFRRERLQDYRGWLLIPECCFLGVRKWEVLAAVVLFSISLTIYSDDFDRRCKVTGIRLGLLPNWNRHEGESVWKYGWEFLYAYAKKLGLERHSVGSLR